MKKKKVIIMSANWDALVKGAFFKTTTNKICKKLYRSLFEKTTEKKPGRCSVSP